jgi:hypothetical protein
MECKHESGGANAMWEQPLSGASSRGDARPRPAGGASLRRSRDLIYSGNFLGRPRSYIP